MAQQLTVSSSPHIRGKQTTDKIMLDVLIALMPTSIAGIIIFGWYSAVMILFSATVCILAEYAFQLICKRKNTTGDLSALVTGVIFALTLPPATPLWLIAVGDIIAIVLIKQLFGGIGQNFINPAAGARVIVMISYSKLMTSWIAPFASSADAVTTATPLSIIKQGGEVPAFMDMFLGNIGGCIGEVCKPAILLGLIYLLVRKVITWEVPTIYVGAVALLALIFGKSGDLTGNVLQDILTGGLLFAAVFMATDYTTNPITFKGKVIFALGCGVFTFLIRYYTNYPGGVSFAIVLMNIITPLIDRFTVPKSFGYRKPRKEVASNEK